MREYLTGGLVQTRHPFLLAPGELQKCDETILRPADQALWKAPGHSSYGTVRSTTISTTVNSNTTMTSSAAFGSDFTSVTRTDASPFITKAAGFGVFGSDFKLGQSVAGTGISTTAYIKRYFDNAGTPTIELSANCTQTISTGTVTIITSDLHVGTWIVGTSIPLYTTIASFTDASTLIMSQAAVAGSGSPVTRTFSETVSGLRALTFDTGLTDVLLAKAADKLYTSPLTAITGTFTELSHGLSQNVESILETIQYKNRYIALTGYDPPRVLFYKDSGSVTTTVQERALGMQPVKDFVGATPVAGSWSSLEDFQNGWYYFLITEVLKLGNEDEVESTYTGDPKAARITTYATQSIQIQYTSVASQPVNDGTYGTNTATHWRVYMAPRQSEEFPVPDLAAFVRVAESPISVASITLTEINPFETGFAGGLDAVAGAAALFPAGSTNAVAQTSKQTVANCTLTGGSNTVTSAAGFGTVTVGMYVTSTNNYVPYGTYVLSKASSSSITISQNATVSSTTETLGFSTNRTYDSAVAISPRDNGTYRKGFFHSFGLHTTLGGFSTGTVTGIAVEVKGAYKRDSGGTDPGFQVTLYKGGIAGTAGSTQDLVFAARRSGSGGQLASSITTLGGQFDTWGVTWTPANFADGSGNFGVLLKKNAVPGTESVDHYIDGVRVIVYAGGSTINLDGIPFRTVTVSDQLGVSFSSGANGPPPTASTGDIFDGMVLLNDVNDESAIVASLPDEEEAYPDLYRLNIESKANDRIRVLRKLNNICIIGCLGSIKRLNYFPKETDANFTQGRVYEDIASDHGMVSPRCAVLVDLPNTGTVLAYLSHKGLFFTDGITCKFLNDDIDWTGGVTGTPLIDPLYIQRSVLEVFPHLSLLALYYIPNGTGTRKVKVMYFSYHPLHIKEGSKLPAVGPTSIESGSAASVLVNGRSQLFTGHSMNGKVYVEDSGTTIEDGTEPLIDFRTRRFIPAGVGGKARIEKFYLATDAAGTTTTGGFTAVLRKQGSGQIPTQLQVITGKTTENGGLIEIHADNSVETFDIEISKAVGQESTFRGHFLEFQGFSQGMESDG